MDLTLYFSGPLPLPEVLYGVMMCAWGLFKLLLRHGADVDAWDGNCRGTLKETPLLLAIASNQRRFVRELISRGVKVNEKSGPVDTPLKAAVLLGHHARIRELLQ